eukprot:scaffold197143_cov27-Tisochrysis_lutea.AAC.1
MATNRQSKRAASGRLATGRGAEGTTQACCGEPSRCKVPRVPSLILILRRNAHGTSLPAPRATYSQSTGGRHKADPPHHFRRNVTVSGSPTRHALLIWGVGFCAFYILPVLASAIRTSSNALCLSLRLALCVARRSACSAATSSQASNCLSMRARLSTSRFSASAKWMVRSSSASRSWDEVNWAFKRAKLLLLAEQRVSSRWPPPFRV